MKEELAHGTSWAILLCFSNFRISMYDGCNFSTCTRSGELQAFPSAGTREADMQHIYEENIVIQKESGARLTTFSSIHISKYVSCLLRFI
jgi:hypothetical protein